MVDSRSSTLSGLVRRSKADTAVTKRSPVVPVLGCGQIHFRPNIQRVNCAASASLAIGRVPAVGIVVNGQW